MPGSGEISPIINVLMRFYEFQSGHVLLDGGYSRLQSGRAEKNIGLVFTGSLPLSRDFQVQYRHVPRH